jgi:DNA-binding LacI/PurR family transcriptional regulator
VEAQVATINDVARLAGVSVSTVSYVINGTRPISEPTADKVRQAMAELGYRPNAFARGLASRRTRTIGLMFPTPERGIGVTELEFVTAAAQACRDADYQMVLWTMEIHEHAELKELTGAGLVDGVIVMEVRLDDDRVGLLREAGMPFALIGQPTDDTGLFYVDIDFDATVRKAVEHLTSLGHTEIALLNRTETELLTKYGPTVRVNEAFRSVMTEQGLKPRAFSCADTPEVGALVFGDLVSEVPELTAIISMNDRATVGVIGAIEAAGWTVPEDYSVMSLVTSETVAQMSRPRLTTLAPQTAQLSQWAVRLLLDQIEGRTPTNDSPLLPCVLEVGLSTGPAPRNRTIRARPAATRGS